VSTATETPGARRVRAGRWTLVVIVLALAAAAWLAIALTGHGADHPAGAAGPDVAQHHAGHGAGSVPIDPLPAAGRLLAGWALMVVAMMLAPALPMLELLRRLVSDRRHPGLLVAVGGLAFVGVWTAVGAVLVTGDVVARSLVPFPDSAALFGAALIVAGGYQLTPFKDACLRACRSPRSFAVAHWHGERPAWVEVATIAGAYAAWCVGCCWALMAAGFLAGAASVAAMVVLTALMAAERLTRWGRRLVRPAGVAAILAGTFLLLPALIPLV
jgi:predicted metal-binding membrane protein